MNNVRTSRDRFSTRIFLFLGIIFLIAALVGCGSSQGSGNPSESDNNRGATPTSTSDTSIGSAPAPGSTTTPAPTNAPAPTNTPTHNSPPQPVAFSVTGLSASASQYTSTTCTDPVTFTITATISAPAHSVGGTVAYTWVSSDGGTGPNGTVQFAAGETSKTVTTTWGLGAVWGNGSTFWEALKVTAPNAMTSPHANFSFHCQRTVTGISVNVSSGGMCNTSSGTFTFTAVISVAPGPGGVDISYKWLRSDSASSSPQVVHVNEGQTSATVTTSWTLGPVPNGLYWEEVSVSSPNAAVSNRAGFSVFAC